MRVMAFWRLGKADAVRGAGDTSAETGTKGRGKVSIESSEVAAWEALLPTGQTPAWSSSSQARKEVGWRCPHCLWRARRGKELHMWSDIR